MLILQTLKPQLAADYDITITDDALTIWVPPVPVTVTAIGIAMLANLGFKLGIAVAVGGRALGLKAVIGMGAVGLGLVAGMLWIGVHNGAW